jgi:cell division transport system permease protein
MSTGENKVNKRRLRGSYVTTTISLSLVLFMIGLVGLLLLNAKKLSDIVKENINFTIVLKPETHEVDILRLQKELDVLNYVKSTEYITQERAASEFKKTLGEDFVNFLGYNPLLSSIEIKLHAGYANSDSITKIENKFKNNPLIQEIIYEKSLIHLVNENIRKISIVILGFSGLLFLIAIALINNTVRLNVYSKRFVIRTMQLVGATKSFIRKPFLINSILHGFLASLISIILIALLIYFVQQELQGIDLLVDVNLTGILFSGLAGLGILINLVSTYFAISKYLNIETEHLY